MDSEASNQDHNHEKVWQSKYNIQYSLKNIHSNINEQIPKTNSLARKPAYNIVVSKRIFRTDYL